jgi:beta-aspartyl-dipeptidase (metallo-type)
LKLQFPAGNRNGKKPSLKIQSIHDNLPSAHEEEEMITLVKGGNVYAPEPLSSRDIVIADGKFVCVSEPGQVKIEGLEVEILDASEKTVAPGFIDSHTHILGGGGEGGPTTRAPELNLEDCIKSGVTTLIGCLGTDGTTRHLESLLAKARALDEEGITTFIFTGSYQIPVLTLTGSVRSDLVLIDKVVGVGEIAISDHRSSQPTFAEFARLAAECRVGGMLGGKAGILHCHLGDGSRKLEYLFQLVEKTEIPITQVIPTHVNRNSDLLDEAIDFVLRGGYVDMTTLSDPESERHSGICVSDAVQRFQEKNGSLSRITISSDSNGSLPVFDEDGNLAGLTIATQKNLIKTFVHMVKSGILSFEQGIRLFSTNPAQFYQFKNKGKIEKGRDADLIMFDEKMNLTDVLARGKLMKKDGQLVARSTFQPSFP